MVSSDTAIVVEGYTDCIMAHQLGCENVVATLGTSFTEAQARLLRRYARQIILVFDSDSAGAAAANRALEVCLSQRVDIRIASVPEGKDPCDFLLSAGGAAFEKLVAEAVDVMQYKWQRLLEGFDGGRTLADKRAAAEEYLRTVATAILAGHLDAIDKGLIVNRLAEIMGVAKEEINAELAKTARQIRRVSTGLTKEHESVRPDLGTGFFARAQQELIEVLLNQPGLFGQVEKAVKPDMFDVPILKQVATVLFETLMCESKPALTQILARVESVEAARVMMQLADQGREKGNYELRLTQALEALGHWHQQRLRKEMAATDDDTESLRRYQSELSGENRRNPGMLM
jgi:DNA primase